MPGRGEGALPLVETTWQEVSRSVDGTPHALPFRLGRGGARGPGWDPSSLVINYIVVDKCF